MRSECLRGPGEASRACTAQPAGARAVPGNDEAWQAPRPAPGGVPVCTARAPELTASRSGADSRGRPTAAQGLPGPRVPAGAPFHVTQLRTSCGPRPWGNPPPRRLLLGPSGQRAARGGAGRRGLRRPREKRAPAPTPAIPARLLRWQGPGIPHSWATAAWRPGSTPSGPPRLAPAPGHAAPLRTCCARPLPFSRPPRPSRPSGSAPASPRRPRPRPGARASRVRASQWLPNSGPRDRRWAGPPPERAG